MTSKIVVTPALLQSLRLAANGQTINNTAAGTLAKLGWVRVRVTRVYGGTDPERTKIYHVTITAAGRQALREAGLP